ncbi:MAG: hypothetical protein OEW83_18495 [Acidimicrobiia bacterium]|nr:hypothetical protein [Acidimicrobiia bacterium]
MGTAIVLAAMAGSCGNSDDAAGIASGEVEQQLAQCPNPLVIQTDSLPEPEHGAVYNLIGEGGRFDSETGRFSGPSAADPALTIEIRAGGPFVDNRSPLDVMADDSDIFLGFVDTDEAVAGYVDHPSTAVVAPLDINPEIIMWDPDTYDIESWSDVKGTGAVLNHAADASYPEYLLATGMVIADQLDSGYDGSPDRFIAADGDILQQGSATRDPYLYENSFTEWGHPVSYLLLHDAGLELYRGALTILDERLDQAARWCLSALVPMIQRSIVDFQQDPTAANNVILDAADTLDGSSPLGDEGAREAVIQMGTLGIVGNGGDTTVGNFDLDRVDEVILHLHDEMPTMAGPVGLSADELVTNEFIDDDIGL